jgi:hypothetical protein
MKFKNLLLIIALFVAIKSNAQEFKLGKVSVAELEEKSHPQDPLQLRRFCLKKEMFDSEYTKIKVLRWLLKSKHASKFIKRRL